MSGGETGTHNEDVKSRSDVLPMDKSTPADSPANRETKDRLPPPPVFNPESLIGHSLLVDKQED
jgi:hypothetical protein